MMTSDEQIRKVTCITINTDASFNIQHKVGGYAFYIVCDFFKIQKSGVFKVQPKQPHEAEMMCIGNALATLAKREDLPECTWIVINSDCVAAMELIKKQKTELGTHVFKILNKVLLKTKSKNNKFRHVKAHNGKPDARSWVNDWCDKAARKQMRSAVKKLNVN